VVDLTGSVTVVPALAGATGAVVIDPREQSWGVYVPDAVTVAALRDELPLVTDDLLRAATWNNLKSGFQEALVAPDDVVELLVAALPVHDTEDTGRHTAPWVLGAVLPAAAPGSTGRVHAAAVDLVGSSEPGSELQLSAFRTAVRTAEDVDLLRGWLGALPDGIELDADVRWRLLVQLAGLGGVGRAELDEALADDKTAATQVSHVHATTALPTEEAKALAWQMFTGVVDAPNYELVAAGQGLWHGAQAELTAPYVERYFAELPATSQVRSGWVLALAADAFFPRTAVDEATLDRGRALLDSGRLEPAVQRRVADQLDTLQRRLAVRAAFPIASVS
jgi:aminopeptidase N